MRPTLGVRQNLMIRILARPSLVQSRTGRCQGQRTPANQASHRGWTTEIPVRTHPLLEVNEGPWAPSPRVLKTSPGHASEPFMHPGVACHARHTKISCVPGRASRGKFARESGLSRSSPKDLVGHNSAGGEEPFLQVSPSLTRTHERVCRGFSAGSPQGVEARGLPAAKSGPSALRQGLPAPKRRARAFGCLVREPVEPSLRDIMKFALAPCLASPPIETTHQFAHIPPHM
jgi:hypothetical protein